MRLKDFSTILLWISATCLVSVGASAQTLDAVRIASGLSSPLMVKSPPGDTSRLFIVERAGRIKLIKNGSLQASPFLDISSQVVTNSERGMLDIAFHPNYASNGYFYVRFNSALSTPVGHTVVRRYTRSGNHDLADGGSGHNVLVLPSGIAFHIGGTIDFGPDGMLYITVGDAVDTTNPQNLDSLFGKILRIDVNGDDFPADPNANYRIPATNPYAGGIPGRDEIWSIGFRNPYRSAFDRVTGDLWIGDVANVGPEEIDFQPAGIGGHNYGWPCREGTVCWPSQPACDCNQPDLVPPIYEYSHTAGNCAVTGGRVYRGCAIPQLGGTYFLADYCSGRITSFRYANGQITELNTNRAAELDPPDSDINFIVGFGEDARGELYICDMGGEIFKIVSPSANGCGNPADINGDGSVDINDLLAIIGAWGPCPGCPADCAPQPAGDGVVNIDDLLFVIASWG